MNNQMNAGEQMSVGKDQKERERRHRQDHKRRLKNGKS